MQQAPALMDEDEKPSEGTQTLPLQKKERGTRRTGLQNFAYWEREAQCEAFFAWLPEELHTAPGIDWKKLHAEIMGYCVKVVGKSPDAAVVAMVGASVYGAIALTSQRTFLSNVNVLLRSLRSTGQMHCLADLQQEQVWREWAACRKKTEGTRHLIAGYLSVATGHFPRYLLRLNGADRQRMQQYALPFPPVDLIESYFPVSQLRTAQQARRKDQTDILVPLYPVLRQLVRFRKQLAERVLLTCREARRQVEAGGAILPYHFQHIDLLPDVSRDARTIAEAQIQGRKVTMRFILWDKRSWVVHHADRYGEESVRLAVLSKGPYTPEHNCLFVQFDGPFGDLLWFGDLVEQRLFQRFDRASLHREGYRERWQRARQLGFSQGCFCDRPKILWLGDHWFREALERGNELIFDFESLYRGILYGAALTMLALSNGSRLNELLQVSWSRERRVTRVETVMLLGDDGQSQIGEDGQPLMKQVKLHFQHLLPKGAKTDEERQLFPLSREAMRLLGEIKTLLEETHGAIPTVAPSRTNTKREHLKPEQYLFQWDASPDGEVGTLSAGDVGILVRFMLHGLDLYTAQGKPIRASVHVLRHVMATHARHYRKVPPEAIAHFFLHHRLRELTGRAPSIPDISEYYTLMPEEQRFAVITADLDEQEEMDHALLQLAPIAHDLEQMSESLQAVYELWHALHPTAMGYCGCPGLCPRGNDRALCLGCAYLVTDPEKIGVARSWRASYAKQAELLEAQGNFIDARQARIKVLQLDDVINVMGLQLQAEADGHYTPLHKVLSSSQQDKVHHEDEN